MIPELVRGARVGVRGADETGAKFQYETVGKYADVGENHQGEGA